MSGKIFEMGLGSATRLKYLDKKWGDPPSWTLTPNFISDNKGNTLVFVASIQNSYGQVKVFEEELKDYIIFKSKKSVNGKMGHGTLPRNTLYIVDIPK